MKEKSIKVYDGLIPLSIQSFILNKVLSGSFPIYFIERSTFKHQQLDENDFIFGKSLITEHPHTYPDPDVYSFLQVLYIVAHHIKFYITDVYRLRYYHQPPSIKPLLLQPHIDLEFPHFGCIYYINDSEGDTVFYNDDKNIKKSISPKQGRLVVFDGSIPHSSSRPAKTHRRILNFNFMGYSYE